MTVETADSPARVASSRAIRATRRRRAIATFAREFAAQRAGMIGTAILLAAIMIAVVAPLIAEYSETVPSETVANPRREPPGGDFLLGTDDKGRPMIALLVWGARTSLLVGLVAAALSIVIGAAIGVAAGYFGGATDRILTRIEEAFLVIPTIPLAIVMVAVIGRELRTIIIVIAITSWAGSARLIRAQTLTVKTRLYVERARALGAGRWHVITRHVLPNVMPIILANLTLTVPVAILTEATLSFLGIGPFEGVSWGKTLEAAHEASAVTLGNWWFFLPAGLAITTVVLAFTMVGNALERVLNPKLRER
jgi:peptide/nickel transport system permease protein